MDDSKPREIELTADLIDYARRSAIKEAEEALPGVRRLRGRWAGSVLHLHQQAAKVRSLRKGRRKKR